MQPTIFDNAGRVINYLKNTITLRHRSLFFVHFLRARSTGKTLKLAFEPDHGINYTIWRSEDRWSLPCLSEPPSWPRRKDRKPDRSSGSDTITPRDDTDTLGSERYEVEFGPAVAHQATRSCPDSAVPS